MEDTYNYETNQMRLFNETAPDSACFENSSIMLNNQNTYIKIESCNKISFCLSNDEKKEHDLSNLQNIDDGKNFTINNGSNQIYLIHKSLFNNWDDCFLLKLKYLNKEYKISTGNLSFNEDLLKIFITYLYSKKIERIQFDEIFNFMEIVFFFQNYYLLQKNFDFLREIITRKADDNVFHKQILQNIVKFYLYSQSKFEYEVDDNFLKSFQDKYEEILKQIISFYFSPRSNLEKDFLKCFEEDFFNDNRVYNINFQKVFEMIFEKLKATETVNKTFLLNIVNIFIKQMPFEEGSFEKKKYLRDCFWNKVNIRDISLQDYEIFIDHFRLFSENEDLENRNHIILYRNTILEEKLKSYGSKNPTQEQRRREAEFNTRIQELTSKLEISEKSEQYKNLQIQNLTTDLQNLQGRQSEEIINIKNESDILKRENYEMKMQLGTRNKFIFSKAEGTISQNGLIAENTNENAYGIFLSNLCLSSETKIWRFKITKNSRNNALGESLIIGIHPNQNKLNAKPEFDMSLTGVIININGVNAKSIINGKSSDCGQAISIEDNHILEVTFNPVESNLRILNQNNKGEIVIQNIAANNQIYLPYFAFKSGTIEYLN